MKFIYDAIDYDLIVNGNEISVYNYTETSEGTPIATASFDDSFEAVIYDYRDSDNAIIEDGASPSLYFEAHAQLKPALHVAYWLVSTHPA